MRELRIAVGKATDQRSTVWWIKSTKADVYVASRMMGGSTKVSLHADGRSQFSLSSDYFADTSPGQPNQARHITKWVRPDPADNAAAFVYRIVVPESELAVTDVAEDLSAGIWLSPPAVGYHSVVGLFLSPRPASDAPVSRPDFVGAIDVDPSRSIVVLHSHEMRSEHDERELVRLRAAAVKYSLVSGEPLQPGFRAIGFFGSNESVPGMLEYLPMRPAP